MVDMRDDREIADERGVGHLASAQPIIARDQDFASGEHTRGLTSALGKIISNYDKNNRSLRQNNRSCERLT
jgi:hypothetical protein